MSIKKAQSTKPGKPSARAKTKTKTSKPKASGTKAPKKATPKAKRKREVVEAARLPCPSANKEANPLLISNRNKRALVITFATLLGGAKGTEDQDNLLIKAVRESGVLWKSGMDITNFTDKELNHHLSQAEQSGRGYAMRCGRNRHDDYLAKYPEKIADCKPFATAFLKLIQLSDEKYEVARTTEMDNIGELVAAIVKARAEKKNKATAKKKPASKKPASTKPATTKKKASTAPKAKRPVAKVVKAKPAIKKAKSTKSA